MKQLLIKLYKFMQTFRQEKGVALTHQEGDDNLKFPYLWDISKTFTNGMTVFDGNEFYYLCILDVAVPNTIALNNTTYWKKLFVLEKGKVLFFEPSNGQILSVGNALQTLLTINILAGTFTKAGQSIIVEFWGKITNTTGVSVMLPNFDGNDIVTGGDIPSSPNQRSFHSRSVITAIPPSDTFKEQGTMIISDSNDGSSLIFILDDNAGGNAVEGAHTINFVVEGQSGNINIELNNWLVRFVDSQ